MTLSSDDENDDDNRPKTVKLQTTTATNQEPEEETDESIGEAFFSAREINSDNSVTEASQQNTASHDENENNTRPKTVTTKRTDEYRQRLVNMGAVSSAEQEGQVKRPYSPKPKSQTCYVCGKEFLLTSLKIHERQCAKKNAKLQEKLKVEESTAKTVSRNSKIPRKLKLDACYLCGKEFLTHSLPIHETQCLKIWKANKTPTATDKTVAELKAGSSISEDHNSSKVDVESAREPESGACDSPTVFNTEPKTTSSPRSPPKTDNKQRGLKTVPCSMCGVEFFAHSLKIHEKNCRARTDPEITSPTTRIVREAANGALPKEGCQQEGISTVENDSPTKLTKKPRTLTCANCGQEFLRSSYAFHEKQCGSKERVVSDNNAKMKPAKKAVDKSPSETVVAKRPKTEKCYICGKEMLKSSLKIHEQQCEKKSTILKNINQQAATQQAAPTRKSGTRPKTEVCYLCGEAFLASSIKVHETRCRKK